MAEQKVLLWLDDYRDPFKETKEGGSWLVFSPIENPRVVWVKTYTEFVIYISLMGLPDAICFDHDLADTHYAPERTWDDPEKYRQWVKDNPSKEKTGMDCAKFLVDYCMDENKPLPLYNIQSANPVGAENIRSLLENYKKHSK